MLAQINCIKELVPACDTGDLPANLAPDVPSTGHFGVACDIPEKILHGGLGNQKSYLQGYV